MPVRFAAFDREDASDDPPAFSDQGRPRVLVTLGRSVENSQRDTPGLSIWLAT